MEVRIKTTAVIILLLIVALLTMSAYFYRGYDQQVMQRKLADTQVVLSQLQLTPQIGGAFQSIGYKVNIVQPQQPQIPPPEPESDTPVKE